MKPGAKSILKNHSVFLRGEVVSKYLSGTGISSPANQRLGKQFVSTTACPTVWC